MSFRENLKRGIRGILPSKVEKVFLNLYRDVIGNLRLLRYAGNSVNCNCCGKSFKRFRSMPLDKTFHNIERNKSVTQESVCPYCLSLPRHRLICYWLDAHNISKGSSVLLFAPEPSMMKWFARKGLTVITADLFDKTADMKVDIQNMNFADSTFDLIICNHVLQYVPDDSSALNELKRILKHEGQGILLLTVAVDWESENTIQDNSAVTPEQRLQLYGESDFIRVYGRSFERIVKDHGFHVDVINGENLDSSLKVGLLSGPAYVDYNQLYHCTKNTNISK